MHKPTKYGCWRTIGLGAAILLLFYGKFILSPNTYFFGPGGDGIKNYYTFAWHIQYDSSYTHFSGMNYPWGEHTVFTDNQPLVSNTARFVNNNIFEIGHWAVGINNILLFIGLLVAIGLLYKIFYVFTQNTWYATAAAIAVGFMSPQIGRFEGHFALAYCFVVPLAIWWAYFFFKNPKWWLSAAMGITMLLLLYIHVYYLVIVVPLLLLLWLFFLLKKQDGITWLKAIPHIFIQTLLPFALYYLWLKTTDTVTDRPTQPFGIVEYAAHWEGLLLPLGLDYFVAFKKLFGVRKVSMETISYVGMPVVLFILGAIGYGISQIFKKKTEPKETSPVNYNKRFLHILLYAAIVVFIYAAFVPFLFNIPSVSKYLGLLKQFRSLGRMLWVVFYGLNIFVFVYIYNKLKANTRFRWLPWALLALLAVEATLYNLHNSKIIDNPYKKLTWIPSTVTAEKYAAIVPIPFFHEGSENIGCTPQNDTIVGQTFLVSWHTGIPMAGVKMSRTSLAQTLKQLEWGYEISTVPFTLQNKNSKKPFLILHHIADTTSLFAGLTSIARCDSFNLYEITPQKLADLIRKNIYNGINYNDSLEGNDENKLNSTIIAIKGPQAVKGNDTVVFVNTKTNNGDSLSLSFWIYAHVNGLPQYKLLINTGNKTVRLQLLDYVKTISQGWIQVKYNFRTGESVQVKLLKEGAAPDDITNIDNLLLLPADVYNKYWYNGIGNIKNRFQP